MKGMKNMKFFLLFMFFMVSAVDRVAVAAPATELKPATLAAFNRYVTLTEARMAGEMSGASPFLWIDRQPDKSRAGLVARLKAGDVVSTKLETRDGTKAIDAPDGMIHHWVGTVLVPGVTLDRLMVFIKDYPRYPKHFGPMVKGLKVLKQTPDQYDIAMRTWTKKVITVVIDADYAITYRTLSPTRVTTANVASNLYEVEDAGTSSEKRTPVEKGAGYLWRINNYCWFDQRAEGVYEQCESVSLTRDIPFGFGWLIGPFVNSIPRETLEFTLGRVRAGVR
jgi:hypothetical protein